MATPAQGAMVRKKPPAVGQACRLITDPEVAGAAPEAGVVEELPAP